MALQLYCHPFSSYSQKALIALYENAIPFEPQSLDGRAWAVGDLARGHSAGRTAADGRTVFKSEGTALEDLAAAVLAYEASRDAAP